MGKYQIHQTDQNEKRVVEALEACGWTVWKIGRPLDLLAAKAGETILIEVKMPKGKLRPSQAKFIAQWPGRTRVLRSVEDVLAFQRDNGAH